MGRRRPAAVSRSRGPRQPGDDALDALASLGSSPARTRRPCRRPRSRRPRPSSTGRRCRGPRPKVSSRSSSSPRARCRAGSGGSSEPSMTSTRGCSGVPRTRTLIGRRRRAGRVGDQLGDAELGALDEVGAADVAAGVDHPAARLLHAAAGPSPSVRAGRSAARSVLQAVGWAQSSRGAAYPLRAGSNHVHSSFSRQRGASRATRRAASAVPAATVPIEVRLVPERDRSGDPRGPPAEWAHGSHAGSRQPAPRRRDRLGLRRALRHQGARAGPTSTSR